ncbi:MAG TPA: prepilin-type N-terminal cleavage/methylation domain-containing protein [Candidatus Polarisedimenticolia bacterium]|nr:prepilin-type N-terminal cleavage/methylation domain-containing protein [Candidatus Polarisedimenticolia bacterium]
MLARLGRRRGAGERGLTYLEVMITIAILLILAAAALPVARTAIRRQKELELRAALREMRNAIDLYKKYADSGLIQNEGLQSEGYPKDLETLVEGVNQVGAIDKKIRFLRRVPKDPMTNTQDWGLRSLQDDPNSLSWGRQNVFDVYTTSEATGLDGTAYNTW